MKVVSLSREDFDGWMAEAGADSFALGPHCHERSETLVFHLGGLVAVRCRTCNLHVCNVAVAATTQEHIESASTAAEPVRLKPGCHPRSGLRLTYSDGNIVARCGRCRSDVEKLAVRAMEEVDHG